MTRRKRLGFSLIEVMVVIALIMILLGILLPAITAVRESAARARCRANLSELGKATINFHTTYNSLPTYNGIFPVPRGFTNSQTTTATTDARAKIPYGSWFVHLLPYVEQQPVYNQITSDLSKPGVFNTTTYVTVPATGVLVSAAVPAKNAYYSPGPRLVRPAIPASYNQWLAQRQWLPTTTTDYSGASVSTYNWSPAKFKDPGTGVDAVYDYSNAVLHPAVPGKDAVYDPPDGGPTKVAVTIFRTGTVRDLGGEAGMGVRPYIFALLLCPSDPSVGSDPKATTKGLVYEPSPWGSTNYLANWNVFSQGDVKNGVFDLPGDFSRIADGTSQTVMYSEAYAWCDGRGRTALLAWHSATPNWAAATPEQDRYGTHNFGITFDVRDTTLTNTRTGVSVNIEDTNYPKGYPNPSKDGITFNWQKRPLTKVRSAPECTTAECCNALTVQTGHRSLNVVMCDGSIRSLADPASPVWRQLLLPADGPITSADDW